MVEGFVVAVIVVEVMVAVILDLVVGIEVGFCFVVEIEVVVADFFAEIEKSVALSTLIAPDLLEDFERLDEVEINRSSAHKLPKGVGVFSFQHYQYLLFVMNYRLEYL
jgi:hypothetical protein